ncbi:NUMOD4 motif-containing HNH endonuclease [Bradyrhizobium erythrophlei]|uniref:NUMOD4 motif-containing HNH endonuclease n=1 Tax=Bradyrhizobium erythrophlei TaxID=1437360 RepID=UPI000A742A78|nr:NUMOD4 motif-containing HNH endonuclease [Bradyrhizobium erythrophlei]
MTERWLPVVGFEGKYEVSELGRVRSLDRIETYVRRDQYSGRDLTIRRKHRGRILQPGPQVSGHRTVVLGRKEGSRLVHHLVLEAFVGPRPAGHEGCHRNDLPDDNRLSNLTWGTRSQNVKDAVRNGKRQPGGRYKAKLLPEQVSEIRLTIGIRPKGAKGKPSIASVAASYGVGESCIRKIINRQHWRSLQ